MYDNGGMDHDFNWRDRIVATPGVVGGKPAIKGTRLSVEFILGLFAQGWTQEQVLDEYEHLTTPDLRAVFAYAAEMLEDEAFVPIRASS
jgi:uncharacterized protein (DUF433 family)